ncbi:DhaG protein [Klebsiella pneumoniae]|nr:DhaG protein [Klebsiella pneumoniae]
MFAGKKSAQIREILISESAWEEMTCLFAPSLTNQQRIIIFGGGLPVIFNEQVIGAVGVSGGTVEQDQLLAQCALDCFSAL